MKIVAILQKKMQSIFAEFFIPLFFLYLMIFLNKPQARHPGEGRDLLP
jgi:hypothetical protein